MIEGVCGKSGRETLAVANSEHLKTPKTRIARAECSTMYEEVSVCKPQKKPPLRRIGHGEYQDQASCRALKDSNHCTGEEESVDCDDRRHGHIIRELVAPACKKS